jgi:hypothetical protein
VRTVQQQLHDARSALAGRFSAACCGCAVVMAIALAQRLQDKDAYPGTL